MMSCLSQSGFTVGREIANEEAKKGVRLTRNHQGRGGFDEQRCLRDSCSPHMIVDRPPSRRYLGVEASRPRSTDQSD